MSFLKSVSTEDGSINEITNGIIGGTTRVREPEGADKGRRRILVLTTATCRFLHGDSQR
jgi:hypothetical protein